MNDRYIIKCTCVKENEFGCEVGKEYWYNDKAVSYKYNHGFRGGYSPSHPDYVPPGHPLYANPYYNSYWKRWVPITNISNNARIYKKLNEVNKVCKKINEIGDFTAEIYKVIITLEKV